MEVYGGHRRTEGGGDGPSPPPLLGHFVKDFTKTFDFSQSKLVVKF